MDVRGTSKRKVDAWFNDVEDPAGEPSLESTECVSEAVAAEGVGGVEAGESSGAKKKKSRRKHKAANPEKWPSKAATKKLHEVALEFMDQYSISQLNTTYITEGLQGVETIKNKFHHMFWTAMSKDVWLEEHTKEDFNRWLEDQVQTCVYNLAQVAEP